MTNKKFWLVILIITLIFGITVVGCEEEETKKTTAPSTPTGLTGTVISSSSIQLNWNSVSNANQYWIEYKENSSSIYQRKEGITTNSYTFTGLYGATKYDFRVAAHNGYTSEYSSPTTVETKDHETASVSVSMYTRMTTLSTSNSYQITISLKLSDKAYWKSTVSSGTSSDLKSWITMSGTPDVSSWTFSYSTDYAESNLHPDTLTLFYNVYTGSHTISGLTATLNTSKLAEMKDYTNVTTSLSAGTPSSASSSTWN